MREFDIADTHWIGACNKRRCGSHIVLHDRIVLDHPKVYIRRVFDRWGSQDFQDVVFELCPRQRRVEGKGRILGRGAILETICDGNGWNQMFSKGCGGEALVLLRREKRALCPKRAL